MSSVLLADPTKSCLKLLLWREAACWVERIVAGDFVYFSCEWALLPCRICMQLCNIVPYMYFNLAFIIIIMQWRCTSTISVPAIRLKSWQEEIVGHTIMYSRVLNLHQPKKSLPSKRKQLFNYSLCTLRVCISVLLRPLLQC